MERRLYVYVSLESLWSVYRSNTVYSTDRYTYFEKDKYIVNIKQVTNLKCKRGVCIICWGEPCNYDAKSGK